MQKKLSILTILLALVFFGLWMYGNSIEQNDMSNAGFQVFGALGTIFFLVILVILFVIKRVSKAQMKKS
jgi:flagellar biogenesis protein FliO